MITTKILLFLLFFAIFDVIHEGIQLFKAFKFDQEFKQTVWRRIGLCTSLSYIFTIIFTGFAL